MEEVVVVRKLTSSHGSGRRNIGKVGKLIGGLGRNERRFVGAELDGRSSRPS